MYIYKRDKKIKEYETKLSKKQVSINKLANQVMAYYALQNTLIEIIAMHTSENPKALKSKYHKQILDTDKDLDVKTWMTSNKAKEYIQDC